MKLTCLFIADLSYPRSIGYLVFLVSCYMFFKFQIVTFLTLLHLLYRVILCYYSIIINPLFYIVPSFNRRVIICKTLKKKGRAFRNIGFKYTQFSTVKTALPLFRCYFLSLIRSFTIRSGTSFLLRCLRKNIELVFIIQMRVCWNPRLPKSS